MHPAAPNSTLRDKGFAGGWQECGGPMAAESVRSLLRGLILLKGFVFASPGGAQITLG